MLCRFVFALSTLTAAIVAHAVPIGLASYGTYDNKIATNVKIAETVFAPGGQHGGYGELSKLSASINSFSGLGTATYTGIGGEFRVSLTVTDIVQDPIGSTQTISGWWSATNGVGTYSNVAGQGTFSDVIDLASLGGIGDSYFTLRGQIQAVPEPTTMMALGLGALLVVRRRR